MLKEKMLEEADCIEANIMDCINRSSETDVFIFYEGKDDAHFYPHRVKEITGCKEVADYFCEGKEKVVELHAKLTDGTVVLKNKPTMYFVDKDFDNNDNISKDIYITDTYSIENLYVSENTIKKILKRVIGINSSEREKLEILEKEVEELMEEIYSFANRILLVNAFYSLQRKKSVSSQEKPNLNSIKNIKQIENLDTLDKIKQHVRTYGTYIEVSDNEIEEEKDKLKINLIENLRGKYLLEFAVKVLIKFFDKINTNEKPELSKKVSYNLSYANIILSYTYCIDTPEKLRSYIKERMKAC